MAEMDDAVASEPEKLVHPLPAVPGEPRPSAPELLAPAAACTGTPDESDTSAGGLVAPDSSAPPVQQWLAPFLGKWFEDKSHGDVSSLNTFLTACDWSWAMRPLLCNAPNQMWVVQQHADDAPAQMRIGVELNALMQKLVQLVGAAPFVRYDCSGAEFEFELFTSVTGYAQVTWEGEALHLHKFIVAPAYVLQCHWVYSIVSPAPPPGTSPASQAEEGVPPTAEVPGDEATARVTNEATRGAAAVDVAYSDREEMWCRQSNRVFKRAAPDGVRAAEQSPRDGAVEGRPWERADRANLIGDAVPEMDHTMHQVWARAQDGDGGVLGMLMR